MLGYIFCILLSYTAGFLMAAVLGTTDEEDDGMKKMKAYACTDRTECDRYAVVFAETPGKAKMIAQRTDACEDVPFTDIWAKRIPALDDAYRGRNVMDWMNDQDRIRMVRDADYQCSYEVDVTEKKCRACPAFQWCGRAEDWRDGV